jgi:hypothetical protein
METILQKEKEARGVNKVLLAALLVGAIIVAGAFFAIWKFQSNVQEQKAQALVGAVREGAPEFAVLTRRIIIENDAENTWESPLGIGTVMMSIAGKVKNKSDQNLTGLEIEVSVLDRMGKAVKKTVETIIPNQIEKLGPQQEMDVVVRIEGFDKEDDRARIQWKVTAIKVE